MPSPAFSFRPLVESDLSFLLDIRNECREFLHDNRPFTLPECEAWFRATRPEFHLITCDDVPIGYFRLGNRNVHERSIHVGADLHPRFRGRGLATAAYAAFLAWLKDAENLAEVRLEVLGHNVAAQRLYVKLGFREVGRTVAFTLRDGVPVDNILMSRAL